MLRHRQVHIGAAFIVFVGAVCVLAFSVWTLLPKMMPREGEKILHLGTRYIVSEVVRSESDVERGLSGRERLDSGTGMLFVFPAPRVYTFWMKEMKFPIDIVWIGADGKIVDVTEAVTPDTYPQTFSPRVPAQYVLEVGAGVYRASGAHIGDSVGL